MFVDVPYVQQQRGVVDCGVLLLLLQSIWPLETISLFNQGHADVKAPPQEKVMMPFPDKVMQARITSAISPNRDQIILLMFDA